MKLEFFIGLRYLMTKRKEKFISLISLISILGVAIGVMALIAVLAVMTGFDKELRDKIIGNYAHVTISSYKGIDYSEYLSIFEKVSRIPEIKGVSPNVQGQVIVKEGEKIFAIGIRGIEPDKEVKVTRISDYLIKGDLKGLNKGAVVVGRELAAYLGLDLNSELTIYSPLAGEKYSLKVAGIFNSGMYDYDLNLIFVSLKSAQEILGINNQVSSIAVKLTNLYAAKKVQKEIYKAIGYEYSVKTWMETNQNFFAALKLEKITMFIILTLIILVASFNIISTLMVMVVEKTKDIGILKAIGVSSKGIRNIFTFIGLSIGGLGIFLGVSGGVALCLLFKKYQFIKLPQDIYYVDRIPVVLEVWPDLCLVVLSALAISLASTIYPAIKASKLKPVEALRYE
ncbi:MAG: ABC transporter permease [Candidatus Omnitrophota bacterium]|nr:ABC transporter permease [Candidatus Omnitrophota bacterium]MBU1928614.1 ABC transporter permease [Candidatus Omnitrophota bacterium]MBU2034627.1 ABC transporter permease [Candidatus Omnitrophota bacterium]MBU2257687.1 ABC transporter permease [Candidatus Omnitrophota bacterium]